MMTTSRVFGISQAGSPPAQQQQAAPAVNVEAEKLKTLQEALTKFMNKEITKAELETIQNALK